MSYCSPSNPILLSVSKQLPENRRVATAREIFQSSFRRRNSQPVNVAFL